VSRFIYEHAECQYAECRYAECRYAECHYAVCCCAPAIAGIIYNCKRFYMTGPVLLKTNSSLSLYLSSDDISLKGLSCDCGSNEAQSIKS